MATTSLGRLTLDLAVRLSEFTDGMSRAERETADRTQRMQESVTSFREHLANELDGTAIGDIFGSLNERFGSLEGHIGKVGGALAGMAVGYAVGSLSKMAIETAKADAELAVFANRANTTVANFQTLATASEGLGVNQEQLASILADTQEKLGEFTATGGGEAADFFDALKNNTKMTDDQIKAFGKTLSGKDGVEAIQIIKNKLDEMGASAQEQRFVFESLGNDLGNLSVIFANGGEIYKKYGDALKESGVLKTQEAIKQSQLLAAQTQSVQQRFDGLKSQLAGAMMPALNGLLQYFSKGIDKGGSLGGVIQGVGIIARTVAGAVIVLSSAVSIFGSTVGQYFAQLTNVAQTAVNVWNADGMEAKMQALSQGWSTAKGMLGDYVSDVTGKFQNAQQSVLGMINNNITQTDTWTQANLALIQSQNKLTNGMGKSTKQANDEADAKDKAAKSTLNHAKALEKVQARLVGISGNSGIGSGAHLDIRESGGDRRLKASELARFQADGKPLTAYRKTSDYGYRGNIGVSGASKYHRGIDFAMPVGTPITTKVPVKSVSNFYDSKGGGYVQRIVFEDGLSVDLLHQSPASKGIKGGSSTTKTTPYSSAKSESYSLIAKSNEDAKREAEQREKERQRNIQTIFERYATKDEVIEAKHKDNLALIDKTYAKNSVKWAKYTKEEKNRYYDEMYEYTSSIALKYATEEEKIDIEHYKKLREIKRDFANDPTERDRRVALQNESYQKDVANFKWAQGEKARAQKALIDKIKDDIGNSTMQSTNDYLDASMKASMSPEQYNRWSLQRDYNNQYSSLYGQYENRQNEINATDERGNFRIDSETERNALLEQARQEHLAKIYTLEADHAAKVKELDKQVNDAKVQQTSAAFGLMTSAMSTFFGQQSIAYKMAANAEKGYALYQAWLNSKSAILSAYAKEPGTWVQKSIAAAKAAADTSLMTAAVAAVSPRGFSTGGYTGNMGVNDIAGVVHGQEFVLNAMATKRIGIENLNSLNNGGSFGGKVIVNNYSGANANVEKQDNGDIMVTIGKMIDDITDYKIEKRFNMSRRQGWN